MNYCRARVRRHYVFLEPMRRCLDVVCWLVVCVHGIGFDRSSQIRVKYHLVHVEIGNDDCIC